MSMSCGKRKRKGSAEEESSSSSGFRNFQLEILSDDLLIEILRRLPTAKSAVGFKLVSKRWSSLISTPYFCSQFITHHINRHKSHYHAIYQFIKHSAVFFSPRDPCPKLSFITGKKNPVFDSPGFTLEFLPEERQFVSVVATCNDLMLCRAKKEGYATNFYICNPFTMKWLLLSPPPISYSRDENDNNFGLVYEPNYERWIQGINECRFRVVYIIRRKDGYGRLLCAHMYTYCSETRQWNQSPRLDDEFYFSSNVVSHYGKLYWMSGFCLAAYDPFTNETFYLNLFDSQDRHGCSVRFCVGICQGFLQVMKVVSNNRDADYFSIWELKDCEARSLSLKHKILFSIDCSLRLDRLSKTYPLAFHPNDMNVVYLQFLDYEILACNIQRGNLEVVGRSWVPRSWPCNRDIFTTVLPWLPTPLPMLPPNSHV